MYKVLIGHAVMDENGKVDGPETGDQTGKEIAKRKWYATNEKGVSWSYYIECIDTNMRETAALYMEQICDDNNFGYSQGSVKRWTGYNSIMSNGRMVNGAKGDFDCSTLVISCYILAGLNMAASGSTKSMYKSLKATGKFKIYTDSEHIQSCSLAKRGGIYLRNGHVLMVLENGDASETVVDETPISAADMPVLGRVTVDPSTVKTICNVRSGPSTKYSIIGKAYPEETYNVIGTTANKKWYMINYKGSVGYISFTLVYENEGATAEVVKIGRVYVTAASVNIRKGPSTSYAVIKVVHLGDSFNYLNETSSNGWYKIEYEKGYAYISGALSKLA